ncbi:MAG: NUDIX domain-containing protein [Candidatus Nomurabacteria bacterium]
MTNTNIDLSLNVGEDDLNIRVAILIKTKNGYILEKNEKFSYYFLVGGRIKINETSSEVTKREIKEEIDLDINEEDLEFKSIIENFFTYEIGNVKTHEICFLYELKKELENINLKNNFVEYTLKEIKNLEIRPTILQKLLLEEKMPTHVIHKV